MITKRYHLSFREREREREEEQKGIIHRKK